MVGRAYMCRMQERQHTTTPHKIMQQDGCGDAGGPLEGVGVPASRWIGVVLLLEGLFSGVCWRPLIGFFTE